MDEPGLPSGTVTFLFTDIEGSTRLLQQLGQHRYDELLTAHREILAAAFAAREGRVVDSQGDSFFVAFRTAADAVGAAVDSQRDLAAHAWPEGAVVAVRMGLHTGEPKVGQERYVGIGVHRAARIGAAGHGGQVLLSWTTKGLAEEDLPPGVGIRDLGERRLKDIEQPQRLYQLVIDGLPSDFGPLQTLDVELARKRKRMYLGAALVGVVAAAVAVPVFALGRGGSGGGMTVRGNSVAEIDPVSDKVVGNVPNVGARPASIAFGSGSLWVANLDDQTVARVDPATLGVKRNFPLPDTPTGLATSRGAVWVVGASRTSPFVTVMRIDPEFDTRSAATRIGNLGYEESGGIAVRGRAVWVAPPSGLLSRLNPATAAVSQRIDPNGYAAGIVVGPDAVWLTDSTADTVTRVDPTTALLTPIAVGRGPSGIAVGAAAVWVADTLDGKVVRIDPATRAVTTTVTVGANPVGVAVGAGAVWVANSGDGTVTRITPGPNTTKTIAVGGSPRAVAIANGHVWVTVQAAAPRRQSGPAGGTVRITAQDDVDSMDPAVTESLTAWQLLYATCAKLLNYPDESAPGASELRPEVAQALPARSTDGRTYTFTIRRGFRFSPPSNQAVTAQTFKYTIERSLSPRLKVRPAGSSGGSEGLGDVVGAEAYMAGRAPHISGITATGNKLTIRLDAPAPDLLTRLTLPAFCAVPVDTPVDREGVRLVPSAGPYYVASYAPGQGVVLKRNPNYHGARPHRLDRIELDVGVPDDRAVREINSGQADYAAGVPPALAPRPPAGSGPGAPAVGTARPKYFVNPTPFLNYLVLNTRRPLFRDVRMRRAVNYAIDRRALARSGLPADSYPERPSDQYLPPGIPGSTSRKVYPLRPDLAMARRLAGRTPRSAVLYTCNLPACAEGAQIIKANLAAIGLDVQVKALTFDGLFHRLRQRSEPWDLATVGWNPIYADPADFFDIPLLSGQLGPPLDDPTYTAKLAAAARLTGTARYLAYRRIAAQLSRHVAPWVAFGDSTSHDLFSSRIGCQVY